MDKPLVSVIVPNFNGGPYIRQALDSIVSQSYKNLEIIVIDDGSTDDSVEVLTEYAAKTTEMTLVLQQNAGVAVARNKGISVARGDYIAFLDSDDYWHPEKLSLQIDILGKEQNFGVCFSSYMLWPPGTDNNYQNPDVMYSRRSFEPGLAVDKEFTGWIYHILLRDVYVWTGTVVIRKEVLNRVGGFNNELKIGEDHDLWLRIADKYQMVKLSFPSALYRTRPNSITKTIHDKNYAAIVVEKAIKTSGLSSQNGMGIDEEEASNILHKLWFRYAYHCYWNSRFELAHRSFKKALDYQYSFKGLLYHILTSQPGSYFSKFVVDIVVRAKQKKIRASESSADE